ncbi:MAG TPA: hypothetical protein VLI40_14155 [Gemmatimonadaceae bacterium]|nr:hypothetical protein [Gemmatimonadaceae bacterium]
MLRLNGDARSAPPDLLERHSIDLVQQIYSIRRLSELSHELRRHQRGFVNHFGWRAKFLHRGTETTNSTLRSAIQEVDIARRAYDAMHAQCIATYQNEIDGVLVQTYDKIKEVRRQRIVVFASRVSAHPFDSAFDRAPAWRRSAEATMYACFDTSATEASRFDFARSGRGSPPSS